MRSGAGIREHKHEQLLRDNRSALGKRIVLRACVRPGMEKGPGRVVSAV